MDVIFLLMIWAGLIFLITRLNGDARRNGSQHRQAREQRSAVDRLAFAPRPPGKAADPACGTMVTIATAKPSFHAGRVYYFCSRECREVFEAAPELYVDLRHANRPKLEQSHA